MKYKNLNLKYAAINGSYLMLICAAAGFAYNFLSQSGFADGTVGIIIALNNVCNMLGQTLFGSIIDKSEKLDEKTFIQITMIVAIVLAVFLIFFQTSSLLMACLVILCFTSLGIGMPFLNSMAFIYEAEGQAINYGLGRGVGSAAYAIGSALIGQLWAQLGKGILPYYIIAFAIITFLLVRSMPTPEKIAKSEEENATSISYVEFFKKYSHLIYVIVGLILMYFTHMLIQVYIAKIIGNIIPDGRAVESVQGTALFIQAMVELPTMFGFALLLKKFSINKLLMFASVFYTLKHFMIYLSGNVTMFYAAMVIQMFSYAVITPGSVYFSNENVAPEDRNKGQAIFLATSTAGGLLASLLGGQLFTFMDVKTVLLVGVLVSLAGTIFTILGLQKK